MDPGACLPGPREMGVENVVGESHHMMAKAIQSGFDVDLQPVQQICQQTGNGLKQLPCGFGWPFSPNKDLLGRRS
jgi:hypothetical protein